LDEKYTRAITSRGETYGKMGQYEAALTDFNRAIELDEKYTRAITSRGETYGKMGQYEAALTDFNRAIELDEWDWAYYQRALVEFARDQNDKAVTDLQQAIRVAYKIYQTEPQHWQNAFDLALYNLVAGNQETAEHLYDAGLKAPLNHLHDAIKNLDEFLSVWSEHEQVAAMRNRLQSALTARPVDTAK
jgi:tetratricopeptide (TPR) repeat protein